MRSMGLWLVAGLVIAAGCGGPAEIAAQEGGFTPPAATSGPWTAASPVAGRDGDPAAVEAVLAGEGLDRRWPRPGVGQWLRDAMLAISGALFSWLRTARGAFPSWLVNGLVGLLLVAVSVGLVTLLAWYLRQKRRRGTGAAPESPETEPPPTSPAGAADWRRRLEEHLAAGRLPEALEALWWWLASSLAGEAADPAWTGRELLQATDRVDLRAPVRDLERLAYGGRPVAADQVHRLWAHLRTAVPRGGREGRP